MEAPSTHREPQDVKVNGAQGTRICHNLIEKYRSHIFTSLRLTFTSLRLTFISLRLTFISLRRTFISLRWAFNSLRLAFDSLRWTFNSLPPADSRPGAKRATVFGA